MRIHDEPFEYLPKLAMEWRSLADPAHQAAARTGSPTQHASAPDLRAPDKQGAGFHPGRARCPRPAWPLPPGRSMGRDVRLRVCTTRRSFARPGWPPEQSRSCSRRRARSWSNGYGWRLIRIRWRA
jgi:hypothetical protein